MQLTMRLSGPIGIFDSGVGGLAVARVIKDLLPHEPIYYVGDTANLPYGEQKAVKLQAYVQAIGRLLLDQGCKVIVIACNTATAAAADLLQAQVGPCIPVLNVIDPVIAYVKQHYAGKKIGLIGTAYTIHSQVYTQKLHHLQANLCLQALPTPLLVPMVEKGPYQQEILAAYLSDQRLADIQALILGCTHYGLIQQPINHYYQNKIPLIEGASLLATALQDLLKQQQLCQAENTQLADQFVVTKLTTGFQAVVKRLFNQEVRLITLPKLAY